MKTRMRGTALAAVIGLVALAGPAHAAISVTMTSPADGTVVSRSATPELAMAGGVTFDVPTPTTKKFYMRGDVCAGNTRLSIKRTGGGADQSCGYVLGTLGLNDQLQIRTSWPTQDGVPLTLDASKKITGVFVVTSFLGAGAAGTAIVDFALTGETATGVPYSLGSDSVTVQLNPLQGEHEFAFDLQPEATADKIDLAGLTLTTYVHGVTPTFGYMVTGGRSFMDVPIYSASFDRRVEVTVDGGEFSSAGITVSEDGKTWSGTMPTPSVGSHFIRARAVQGTTVSGVVSNVLHVTQ